jgi:hypothetical protein
MKKYGGLLAALVLLFAGCSNPVTGDGLLSYNDIYDLDEEEYINRSGVAAGIVFADAGLVGGTDTVNAGAVAVTVAFPASDGPWAAELVSGQGSNDNGLFDIRHVNDDGEEDEAAPAKAQLVIKEGTTLLWGPYSVRAKIHNGDGGLVFVKTFAFEVTLCPPLFKDAPKVYPFVEGNGKNKLVIRWPKRATATSYTVYVGETDDFSAASVLSGTYNASADNAEMTAFNGADLPDNTAYWVWVTATNSSGTTPPSPAAKRKTSLPIQPYFYDQYYHQGDSKYSADAQTGRPWFHGSGDNYYFTNTTSPVDAGTLGSVKASGTIQYSFGSQGYNYTGDVVYHETWYQGENGAGSESEDNGPFPDMSKSGADCFGLPAGVFVIKYKNVPLVLADRDKDKPADQKRVYSAVYYWGMGAIRPVGSSEAGRMESNIVNQWAGYAETVTMEEALDRFTAANVATFLGLIPEPYYKDFE